MPLFESRAQQYMAGSGITINGNNDWDIQINDPTVYRDTFLKGSLGFGDAYVDGKWDVEKIDEFFVRLLSQRKTNTQVYSILGLFQVMRSVLFNNQIGRKAFHVGERHYDLGNDMYELMLGESMGYSSALFESANDSLTTAQYNKFDALCKKLDLQPGMRILEIGAGWGTFARHAAKEYGVEVVGLTVSKEQKAFAEERCAGLPVSFILQDYRTLSSEFDKSFDRVVSIEMIEAVGKKNFKTYFKTIERVLKDSGMVGLQAIVGTGRAEAFLSTRIFPNGLVPSQKHIVDNIRGLLRIEHWHSFGKDYDKTLIEWDKNFRKHWPKIRTINDDKGNPVYDDAFYRMWRYYLLLCAASFRVGHNDVAQIVLCKPDTAMLRS